MPKISKEEIIKAVERYKRGEMSQKAEAKKQGVSHQTFQDWIRRYETFGSDGFGNTGNRKFRKHKGAGHGQHLCSSDLLPDCHFR